MVFEDIMAEGVDIGGPSAVCMKKSESPMESRLLLRMMPGLGGGIPDAPLRNQNKIVQYY